MSLLGDGEKAMFQVLSGHGALTALLLGGADGIVHGIPQRILADPLTDATAPLDTEDFPIVTFHGVTALDSGPSIGDATIEINTFVWPSGSNGGEAKLDEIDGVIGVLLRGAVTTGNGHGLVFKYLSRTVAVRPGMVSRSFVGFTPLRRARSVRLGF